MDRLTLEISLTFVFLAMFFMVSGYTIQSEIKAKNWLGRYLIRLISISLTLVGMLCIQGALWIWIVKTKFQ